ncbi:MAG TPA: NBR1-Ig-like domain-containing protein [Terriglobia bacterium]|nr:NBR1-Ig-like domain-containing protein [Terriglobia bacterium]
MKKQTHLFLVPAICLLATATLLSSCNLPVPAVSQAPLDSPTAAQQALSTATMAEQVLASPVATLAILTSTATPTLGPTAADCDLAKFIMDVNYPDNTVVKAGEAFTKTWRIQNLGSCTWDAKYKLVFMRGEQMDGPSPAEVVTTSVKPGDSVDLSAPLKAPSKNGTHWGVWQLYNGAGNPVKKADGTPQEMSVMIVIQDGTGGMVTKVQGWRYTYAGGKCSSNSQYDVWTSIFADGPVDASYVWSTTNGVLTVVSQSYSFADSGSQEVTTHISPPFANPANIRVSLTVNGNVLSSFTICP